MINDEDKAKIIFNRILNIEHRLSSVESEILETKNSIIQGNLISVKKKFIERINSLKRFLVSFFSTSPPNWSAKPSLKI